MAVPFNMQVKQNQQQKTTGVFTKLSVQQGKTIINQLKKLKDNMFTSYLQ